MRAWSVVGLCVLVPLLSLVAASAAAEQEAKETAAPAVRIEAIEITPDKPASDTLCQLTVRLHNGGERSIYAFAFDVKLNGQNLPVYDKQLFLQPIAAGESDAVRLFNFWTSETHRPAPADGKLVVAVTLREAQWLEISTEQESGEDGKDQEPIEVWTPVGPVAGLPVTESVTLELRR